MSRILLVNSNRFKHPWPVVPLGVCCVAAACEEAGHEPRVLDLCFSRDCSRDLRQAIERFKPDAIGIGIRNIDSGTGHSTVFLLDQVKEQVVMPLKEIFAGPVLIGGPAVAINAREMLEFFDLEYAARGDGEAIVVEFLKRLAAGQPCEGMEGLVVRRNGQIVQDPPPWRVGDLDSFPLPKLHRYIDLKSYRRFNSPPQIQTKRGCSLKCCYCTYSLIEGREYRLRSPELIAEQVEILVKETATRRIEFADSAFNIPLDHAKAVLRALIRRRLDVRFTTRINPGAVDDELADLLQEAGVVELDIGAESGCDITLESLGKNYTKEQVVRAGAMIRQRGIAVSWSILFGAPAETVSSVEQTLDTIDRAARGNELVFISIGVRLYNGAPIAEMIRQQDGTCTEDNFLHPVDFKPDGISLAEIRSLVKRRWFTRPNYFIAPDDETAPIGLQILGATILNLLGSKQPVWRLLIFLRRLESLVGARRVKRWLWQRNRR